MAPHPHFSYRFNCIQSPNSSNNNPPWIAHSLPCHLAPPFPCAKAPRKLISSNVTSCTPSPQLQLSPLSLASASMAGKLLSQSHTWPLISTPMEILLQFLPEFDPVDHILLLQILFSLHGSDTMLFCSSSFSGNFCLWPPLLTPLPHHLLNVGVTRYSVLVFFLCKCLVNSTMY